MNDLNSYDKILDESELHLNSGRYRLALKRLEKLYHSFPSSLKILKAYSEALLKNNQPNAALEIANKMIKLSNESAEILAYRAMIQTKICRFETAEKDIDASIQKQNKLITESQLIKAKLHAHKSQFQDAVKILNSMNKINLNGTEKEYKEFKSWLELIEVFNRTNKSKLRKRFSYWSDLINIATDKKQYWFCSIVLEGLLEVADSEIKIRELKLLEVKNSLNLYNYEQALLGIEKLKSQFPGNEKINSLYENIVFILNTKSDENIKRSDIRSNYIYKFYNSSINIFSFRIKDYESGNEIGELDDKSNIKHILLDLFLENPFFNKHDSKFNCSLSIRDEIQELQVENFSIILKENWQSIKTAEKIKIQNPDKIQGVLFFKLYINNELTCEYRNNSEKSDNSNIILTDHQNYNNEEFDDLIGLNNIKEELLKITNQIEFNSQRKSIGLKSNGTNSFNLLFTGNPGTGKTTVARMLGKLFLQKGILNTDKVIEVDRSDLVGQYIGETAQKTNDIIEKAENGILFIDEAYSLAKKNSQKDFGNEAIEILLRKMDSNDSNLIVIAAGYQNKMDEFLNSNPGLKSRFQFKLNFPDYTPDELIQIIVNYLKAEDYKLSANSKKAIHSYLIEQYRNRNEHFGNARFAIQLAEKLKIELAYYYLSRPAAERDVANMSLISQEIFNNMIDDKINPKSYEIKVNQLGLSKRLDELNRFIGLKTVKESIEKQISGVRISQIRKNKKLKIINKSLHSVFVGNPGTGKSTIARLYSRILKDLGVLERGHLVEVDRSDLVAGFVGQTAIKTNKLIDSAIGGVLFIDEAYSLNTEHDHFGSEAISTLLKRMEDDKDKFIVIIAGYSEDIIKLLHSNPGLKSRFTNTIQFLDYSAAELLEITIRFATDNGYKIENAGLDLLLNHYLHKIENKNSFFGNARYVNNLFYMLISEQEKRLTENLEEDIIKLQLIKLEDIQKAIKNNIEFP